MSPELSNEITIPMSFEIDQLCCKPHALLDLQTTPLGVDDHDGRDGRDDRDDRHVRGLP